jgi:hypothetical protein
VRGESHPPSTLEKDAGKTGNLLAVPVVTGDPVPIKEYSLSSLGAHDKKKLETPLLATLQRPYSESDQGELLKQDRASVDEMRDPLTWK